MKKFTKVLLIIVGILIAVGIVSAIAAVSMGLTWGSLSDMVKEGRFNFAFDTDEFQEELIDNVQEELVGTDASFENIDIEFGNGVLKIVYAEQNELTVQHNANLYECRTKAGTFYIKAKKGIGVHNRDAEIIVTLPKEKVLNEVDLEIGAGKVEIENLVAQSFEIEVGAGEANLIGIDVKEFDAKVGAGKVYAQLVGAQTDYSYEAEYGIGTLMVGNTSLSGLGGEREDTNPRAKRHMDLECGVGEMKIAFAQ